MKPSQILIEAANILVPKNSSEFIRSKTSPFCCHAIAIINGDKLDAIDPSSITQEVITFFSLFAPINIEIEQNVEWFNYSDPEKAYNHRMLAMCFASYIAYLEGN